MLEPRRELLGREHSNAGRGELDRERETVHATADIDDVLIGRKVRPNRSSTIHEHGDGITLGQRLYLELALGGDPQHDDS